MSVLSISQYEYNLVSGSLKYSTLQRHFRNGVQDVGRIKNGRPAFLPRDVEINLMKLVLACDERGDRSAGAWCVRHAMGLYIKGTIYEKKIRHVHMHSYMCVACYFMHVVYIMLTYICLGKTIRGDMTKPLGCMCLALSGTTNGWNAW